ncbi:MAG TPA: hypothetical protein VMV44_14365 [Rectinemataceae bacterium]|nr:hypothetical protein [Rectinemataceae bacterium]
MSSTNRRLAVTALVAVLSLPPCLAASFQTIDPRIVVVYVPMTIPLGSDGNPAGGPPLLTYMLGAGSSLDLGGGFTFEPALGFFSSIDLWDSYNLTVLPTEQSWRTSYTMNFLLQLPFAFTLRFAGSWSAALSLGPAFDFRVGILDVGPSDVASASPDMPLINAWFWQQGRWLMPESAIRVGYRLTDRVEFAFSALAFWPIYNLWLSPKPAFGLDGGIFGGELLVKAKLR